MRALLGFLALACACAAQAWGPEGHKVVGDIAQRHLSSAATSWVVYLLRYDRLVDGSPSHRTTLGQVASWADEIKDAKWGRARGSWHYDDIPVCGAADPRSYCKNGNCASARFQQQLAVLADRQAPLRRRNEALKWVVHLAGDMHQPLHATDHHDSGGNKIEVSFFGERENPPYGTIRLHTVWDINIPRRLLAERGGEVAFLAQPVAPGGGGAWERAAPAEWMAESHALAKSVAYANLPGGFACSRKITGVLALGQDYYAQAAPVVEQRLRMAGIRLARVLNDTLQ